MEAVLEWGGSLVGPAWDRPQVELLIRLHAAKSNAALGIKPGADCGFYSTCRHLFLQNIKSSALNTKSFYILGNTFYIFNISGKQDVKDFVQTNSMTDKLNFNLTVVLTTK